MRYIDLEPVRLSPSSRKVLGVILQAADEGKTLTLREIYAAYMGRPTGHMGLNWMSECVDRLVALGLVTVGEPTPAKRRPSRTIRPACRVRGWTYEDVR